MALSETALCDRYSSINNLVKSSFIADAFVKTIQPMALVGIMLLLPPLFLGLGVWQLPLIRCAASEIFWCLYGLRRPDTSLASTRTPSRDAIDATLRAGGRRTRYCRCRATTRSRSSTSY